MLPTSFLPWELVYQQTQRWLNASCFEAMVNDLRSVLRLAEQRQGQAVRLSSMGVCSSPRPRSGPSGGYGGYKRTRGGKGQRIVRKDEPPKLNRVRHEEPQ